MSLFFDFVRPGLAAGKTAPISLLLRDGKKTKNSRRVADGFFGSLCSDWNSAKVKSLEAHKKINPLKVHFLLTQFRSGGFSFYLDTYFKYSIIAGSTHFSIIPFLLYTVRTEILFSVTLKIRIASYPK